ncbi:hypothetical protein F4859DRAFT_377378 [Xylaria cf. heliscus]|nr:hypothetical protein F4859DRAFT_377378 [Xylaria cf. heliscus]
MEDAATIAAWAALAAAILALLVALAQAIQQYVATAQSMRKCEASVWGPMPGHPGRRVWVWQQLRFRVVFDMPNIFIPVEYWYEQGNPREFAADRITTLPAPFDQTPSAPAGKWRKIWKRKVAVPAEDPEGTALVLHYSEAGWVSFARHISYVCPASIRLGLTRGDVDRLPSDLTVVPMQVSLRDAVALGLMIGMTIVNVSQNDIEMSGPSGVIKSSEHPLLGWLLHYTAYTMAPRSIKGLVTGKISMSWLHRLEGIATIAMQQYEEPKRRYYESIGMRWRSNAQRLPQFRHVESDESEDDVVPQLTFTDVGGKSHTLSANECETWEALVSVLEKKNIATAPYIVIGPENKPIPPKNWKALHRVVRQGDLNTNFKIKMGDYVATTPLVSHSPNMGPINPQESNPSVIELQGSAERVTASHSTPSVDVEKQPADLDVRGLKEPPRPPLTPPITPESTASTAQIPKGFDFTFTPPLDTIQEDDASGSQQQPTPEPDVPRQPEEANTQSLLPENINGGAAQRVKPKKPLLALMWEASDPGSKSAQAPPSNAPGVRTRIPPPHALSVSSESEVSEAPDSEDKYSYPSNRQREHRERRYSIEYSRRRPPSLAYDSEQYWRQKQLSSYATQASPRAYPDPPVLSFFWASQIDVELGPWASPWSSGLFVECGRALEHMVNIGLAGLAYTAHKAVSKRKQDGPSTNSTNSVVTTAIEPPPVEAGEIRYVDFQDAVVLKDIWVHLREGKHTWPPYAVNARRGFMTTSLSQSSETIKFAAFRDHELLPPLVLLESVRRSHLKLPSAKKGGSATSSGGSPTSMPVSSGAAGLARDRLVELASIDCWLWRASEARSVAEGVSGAAVTVNAAAIVEEIWLVFGQRIMDEWEEQMHERGDARVQSLARTMSRWLAGILESPAERYFVWVAFLRATKAMVCVDNGPKTGSVLDIFKADSLVFLL